MDAIVSRTKCQHSQEYGDTYAVLYVYDDSGIRHTLSVPMAQYDDYRTPDVLNKIATAINSLDVLKKAMKGEE